LPVWNGTYSAHSNVARTTCEQGATMNWDEMSGQWREEEADGKVSRFLWGF
jgi:hypothetical protein